MEHFDNDAVVDVSTSIQEHPSLSEDFDDASRERVFTVSERTLLIALEPGRASV